MATFLQREHELEATGSKTSIPPYDVCRLSYYLNCIDRGCGVDVIRDKKLLDYKNARHLPRDRQDTIFQLAYGELGLEEVLDKVIFLDDEHQLLPHGDSNEFYKVKSITSVLSVDSEALIAGQQTEVTKIMVCTEDWLDRHYFEPLRRNRSRARPAQDSDSEDLAGLLALLALLSDD